MFELNANCRWHVLTLGETMLRFTPPDRMRLEQSASLDVHVGGSESNTAVGLARLGLRVAWMSRLPDSGLGRIITGELAKHGVDVSTVQWSTQGRVGLYFLEEAGPPRGSQVIYDRRDSAISLMTVDQLDSQLLAKDQCQLFHTTGITLALSASVREVALQAAKLARRSGSLVSFDVNYRGKLWSTADAARACREMFALSDLIFLPDRDAAQLFGVDAVHSPEQALRELADQFPHATWVMTRGKSGAMAWMRGQCYSQSIFPADEIGRLGGGDAFAAGFLARWLESRGDAADALQFGAATAALKYSIPGDLPIVTRSEVESIIASGGSRTLTR